MSSTVSRGQPLSINLRLLCAAAIILTVFMCLTAIVLERAFVSSLTRAQAERLQSNILLLLAAAESTPQGLEFPQMLEEPRFNQPESGLYGFVYNLERKLSWETPSTLLLEKRDVLERFRHADVGSRHFSIETDRTGRSWLLASLGVAWEDSAALPTAYTFVVLESGQAFQADRTAFRNYLWGWLFAIGVFLLLAILLLLRWGLLPLRRFASEVEAVEQGATETLAENYPRELRPLAQNLNRLLLHEKIQREQYKGKLADLAHSLKTPLSVARGELQGDIDGAAVAEQIARMDDIIQHQLRRATLTSPAVGRQHVLIRPPLDKLLAALKKVYVDKALQFDVQCPPDSVFRGDASDLLEMLGNLIDNACKYSASKVRVSVSNRAAGACLIRVEDDGPGVAEGDRATVLERGQRLDTRQPGQGIGLAVVQDIVSDYDAELVLTESALGGACFELHF